MTTQATVARASLSLGCSPTSGSRRPRVQPAGELLCLVVFALQISDRIGPGFFIPRLSWRTRVTH
jgi:hypothetical protein